MVVSLVSSDGIPEWFSFPSSSISLKIIWVGFYLVPPLPQIVRLIDSSPVYCHSSVAPFSEKLASSTLERHSEDHSQAAFYLDCSLRAVRWSDHCSWLLQEAVLRRVLKACWLFDSYLNTLCLLGKSGVKTGKKKCKEKVAVDCSA